jgi:hypothetical protein
MTRAEKQRIIQAKQRYSRAKYPSITPQQDSFDHYGRTDTTANGLTACVCDYLKYEGHQAERVSNQGQARVNKVIDSLTGQQIGNRTQGVTFTPGQGTRGTADIHSTIGVMIGGHKVGISVKIEIKMKDKQSEAQKKYQESITASGGVYVIVHSMEEFFWFYDNLINKYK